MEQTATDWLIEELTPSIALQQKHIDELKQQAKEMEKQQIIDAYIEASENPALILDDAEQYYKQQFKNK